MSETPDLIDTFVRGREALLRVAEAVPAHRRETPFVGHWDLTDLLAHLIGWDYTNLDAIEELESGRVPDFYRHYDAGWASYNQQLIERYGEGDWEALLGALQRSQEAVVGMLRLLTPEQMTQEISGPGRRRPVSIASILRAAIVDEREHARQISTFVDACRSA